MQTTWIASQVLSSLGRDGAGTLRHLLSDLERETPGPEEGVVERVHDGMRFQVAALVSSAVGVLDARPVAGEAVAPATRRDLLVPADVLEDFVSGHWPNVYARLLDLSDIDESRKRKGLKYQREGAISTIFIPGLYRRMLFVEDGADLVVALDEVDGELFTTHSASASLSDPSSAQRVLWRKIHDVSRRLRAETPRLRSREVTSPAPAPAAPRASAPPAETKPPAEDGWITLNKLRELGVSDGAAMHLVLGLRQLDDFVDLMGRVPDATFERIEHMFTEHQRHRNANEARKREAAFSTIEIVQLSGGFRPASGAQSFDEALAQLTPEQRQIVTREVDAPMRIKGGPGTGKTMTALLRAGFLARRASASESQRSVRVGFVVFNASLAVDVARRLERYGLGAYLRDDSKQRIVVTSLHEWSRRLVNLDELKIEPLEPYRADRTQVDRRAALELAVEEARKRLTGAEYESLWKQFDVRSQNGLWEIETEISQFIKARDITDLQAYLNVRRPAGWWLANTERAFKTFVWEVAKVYNEVLERLGVMDADDLTNDAIKTVSQVKWQTFEKPRTGFDYLILDEAQDFFRNQLTLIRFLLKKPQGLTVCYDENQAVYARYPSLRDIGFDTDATFFSSKLDRNFRSTRAITAALRQLTTAYPTMGVEENWGDFVPADGVPEGAPPRASGFGTEDGMFDQVRDIVRRALERRVPAEGVGIIGFDGAVLGRLRERLGAADVRVHVLDGRGRRPPRGAVSVADARNVKGQQFKVCLVVGAGRDQLPDYRGVVTETHRASRRDDDLRLFLVAASRAEQELHFLWVGAEPSEFVQALRHTVEMSA